MLVSRSTTKAQVRDRAFLLCIMISGRVPTRVLGTDHRVLQGGAGSAWTGCARCAGDRRTRVAPKMPTAELPAEEAERICCLPLTPKTLRTMELEALVSAPEGLARELREKY